MSHADILVHNHTQAEADAAFAAASPKDRAQVLIMEQFQKQKFNNAMQLSYILATAEHETDSFRTMKEYGGEKKRYAPWYGRGYPQLTHDYNYVKYKKFLGMDIVSNPDLMLREDVSAAVIVDGMMYGEFTGVKFSHFINDNRCDFLKARRTVNGDFHADRVATIAKRWAQYFRDRKNSQYASLLNWLMIPANHHSCDLANGQQGDL